MKTFRLKIFWMLFFEILLATVHRVDAASAPSIETLDTLVQFALEHSHDLAASEADIRFQERNRRAVIEATRIPQIDVSASYQSFSYDRPYQIASGGTTTNDGHNPAITITVTYDLQKLFGPESDLAKQAEVLAKVQAKIVQRGVVRNVKKSYFAAVSLRDECEELRKQIDLFARIDSILRKQSSLGVYNSLERQQFQIQQGLLDADLNTKLNELDAAYAGLSLATHLEVEDVRHRVDLITGSQKLRYANNAHLDDSAVAKASDKELLRSMGLDFEAAELEAERFHSIAFPSVYVRGGRSWPTMLSSDGPQTYAEAGLTYPLNSLFTRSEQKAALLAKAERGRALLDKAIFEYHNHVLQKFRLDLLRKMPLELV